MRKIVRELRRQFPDVVVEVSNGRVVMLSATPSDRRFMQNVRSDVRRTERTGYNEGRER